MFFQDYLGLKDIFVFIRDSGICQGSPAKVVCLCEYCHPLGDIYEILENNSFYLLRTVTQKLIYARDFLF